MFIQRRGYIFLSVILFVLTASVLLYALSTGITGATRKNGSGCTCHNSSPSSNVVVTIVGPDTLITGQKSNYSVTISGGPLARAGTDVAVSSGTLAIVNSDLRSENGELTHSLPKAPSGGKVTFSFSYSAPQSTGTVTMFANGNSVNFNGAADPGDQWNFAPNKIITVLGMAGVTANPLAVNFKLDQNYPNPFNPSTQINFSLAKAGNVKLEVYNTLGEKVRTIVNQFMHEGTFQYTFNASGLPSGVYIYKLDTQSYSQMKKMVYLK